MNLVTEDSSVDLKDFEHSDCVHRGSTVLRNKVDIEKISNIKCNIFDGNIKINLIDGSNSIASLGSINTIKGDLIIGDFEEGGSFNEELKNIDGFLGLLSVEKLIIQDAPMIYNLDVFYNLGEIEEIYVVHDPSSNSSIGFQCSHVDDLVKHLDISNLNNSCNYFP